MILGGGLWWGRAVGPCGQGLFTFSHIITSHLTHFTFTSKTHASRSRHTVPPHKHTASPNHHPSPITTSPAMFFGRCNACGKKSDELARCKPCQSALYCNRQCQVAHLKAHREDCERRQAQLKEDRDNGRLVYSCARCISKEEVRYFTFPGLVQSIPSVIGFREFNPTWWCGKKMCGKCASYLGIQVPNDKWLYQDPDVARRYAKENPFERICAQCKKSRCNYACPDCDRVWYCGVDCRTNHLARHEKKCQILQRRRNTSGH
eukprot:scaffold12995_cov61-Cyclotella_meneghiniana.AAC.7